MHGTKLIVRRDGDDLARCAAEMIAKCAREVIAARGRFSLVLTGGSTPEKTYKLLGRDELGTSLDWQRAFLFLGDERFVPPDDPASNYGMACRTLIKRVPVPAANVFPMPTDGPDPANGARQFAETIGRFFQAPVDSMPAPSFDLVLLGLGDDGHTASLFPGKPALAVKDRWVTSSPPGTLPPPVDRITLTFPILNRAQQVLFLVAGEKKAQIAHEILEGSPAIEKHPAVGIRPEAGTVTWLLDEAAARWLERKL